MTTRALSVAPPLQQAARHPWAIVRRQAAVNPSGVAPQEATLTKMVSPQLQASRPPPLSLLLAAAMLATMEMRAQLHKSHPQGPPPPLSLRRTTMTMVIRFVALATTGPQLQMSHPPRIDSPPATRSQLQNRLPPSRPQLL